MPADWEAKARARDARSKAAHKAEKWPMNSGSLRNPDIASKRTISRAMQLKILARRTKKKEPEL